jgi:hypothetical protein
MVKYLTTIHPKLRTNLVNHVVALQRNQKNIIKTISLNLLNLLVSRFYLEMPLMEAPPPVI